MGNHTLKKTLLLSLLLMASFCLWHCGDKPDYWPTQGWKTMSPESQGMDSTPLLNMMEVIWQRDIDIDSVLVVRNGYIVLEAYCFPGDADTKQHIYSCSKSVASTLIGIAVDKNYIKDVDQPVLGFFPERSAQNVDANKQAMTLEHLLTMSSGLECRDTYRDQWIGLKQIKESPDWVQFVINLPMDSAPGTRFNYCNSATFLLSAILQQQTNMNALSFAQQHLFEPLGISDTDWPANPQGITIGWGKLHMRPRDMAKIGYLYLNKGSWDDKQIVSSQWIEESTRKHAAANPVLNYGYQWWTTDSGEYLALGYGGQYIFVVPDKNIVAVFTSHLSQGNSTIPFGLLYANIIPAVKSRHPLPENPKNKETLESLVALWQRTRPEDRDKTRKETQRTSESLLPGVYVNKEFGFSVQYDPQLIVAGRQLHGEEVLRRTGPKGTPIFVVAVADIPKGMELQHAGKLVIDLYKEIPRVKDPEIYRQELITLTDGTAANYVEVHWKYRSYKMQSIIVQAYKGSKIIGVGALGLRSTPKDYLANMAKTLRLKME